MAYKNIAVKPETYERFKKYGTYGETADDVMNVILGLVDKTAKFISEAQGQRKRSTREPITNSNG